MPGPVRSRVRPHAFERDHDVPTDYYRRAWCRRCHLPGTPGDERHPTPDVSAETRALTARILGERNDREDDD